MKNNIMQTLSLLMLIIGLITHAPTYTMYRTDKRTYIRPKVLRLHEAIEDIQNTSEPLVKIQYPQLLPGYYSQQRLNIRYTFSPSTKNFIDALCTIANATQHDTTLPSDISTTLKNAKTTIRTLLKPRILKISESIYMSFF